MKNRDRKRQRKIISHTDRQSHVDTETKIKRKTEGGNYRHADKQRDRSPNRQTHRQKGTPDNDLKKGRILRGTERYILYTNIRLREIVEIEGEEHRGKDRVRDRDRYKNIDGLLSYGNQSLIKCYMFRNVLFCPALQEDSYSTL